MELEKLLNKLIEKGWKPRGENVELHGTSKDTFGEEIVIFNGNAGGFKKWGCTYRELVSKESGLWQFVCKNNLIQTEHGYFIDNGERAKNVFYKIDTYDEEGDVIQTGDMEGDKFIGINEYEYRLIESALCNEDKLEKFLLDNIKVR